MQLHHGDCLEILPTLPDKSIDAIICDPPYGTTACKWDSVIPFEPMWAALKRLIKPRGAIVLFGSQPFTSALVMSNPKWFRYDYTWLKTQSAGFFQAKRRPLRKHEDICVFYKEQCTYNLQMIRGKAKNSRSGDVLYIRKDESIFPNRTKVLANVKSDLYFPSTILDYSCERRASSVHPTQKPLALLEYLVKTYTNEGDTVLDFTMGSGTTGHACVNLNRNFIGIEKDDHYFNIASERINTALSTPRQQTILD